LKSTMFLASLVLATATADLESLASNVWAYVVKSANSNVHASDKESVKTFAELVALLPSTHIGEVVVGGGQAVLDCASVSGLDDDAFEATISEALANISNGGRRRSGSTGLTPDVETLIENTAFLLEHYCVMDSVLYHLTDFYSAFDIELNLAEIEFANSEDVPEGFQDCQIVRDPNSDADDAINEVLNILDQTTCEDAEYHWVNNKCITQEQLNRLETLEVMYSHLKSVLGTNYLTPAMYGWMTYLLGFPDPVLDMYKDKLVVLATHDLLDTIVEHYYSGDSTMQAKVNEACNYWGLPTISARSVNNREARSADGTLKRTAREILLELLENL